MTSRFSGSGAPVAVLSDRPVFVSGCPRSGTTLLQVMLHAHPRLAMPPETRHLLPAYRERAAFGDLRDPDNRERVVDFAASFRKFKDLRLDDASLRRRVREGPPTIGSVLGLVLQEYAGRFGKPRWGDKLPLYLMEYEVIFTLFPDAQLVNVIRDGRACVASLKRMPWWRRGVRGAMERWVESIRKGRQARASLRPDQYFEVQYEQLVTNPEPVVEKLCAFLGEQVDEAMLAPHVVAPSAVPKRKHHHARTREPISAAAVEAWRAQLSPAEIVLFEDFAGPYLTEWGYELVSRPSSRDLAGRAHLEMLLRAREVKFASKRAQDRLTQLRYRQPVAARLTSGQLPDR